MEKNITLYDIGMAEVNHIAEPRRKKDGRYSLIRGMDPEKILLQMLGQYIQEHQGCKYIVGALYMLDNTVIVMELTNAAGRKSIYRNQSDEEKHLIVRRLHSRHQIEAFLGLQQVPVPEEQSDEYAYFRFIHFDESDETKYQKITAFCDIMKATRGMRE